jgi:hypothetical protein
MREKKKNLLKDLVMEGTLGNGDRWLGEVVPNVFIGFSWHNLAT